LDFGKAENFSFHDGVEAGYRAQSAAYEKSIGCSSLGEKLINA
jgi:hypothetical protein